MGQQYDPRNVFTNVHHNATGELLHLIDGFYLNMEDGLFELAFGDDAEREHRRCFELMREMRYRRGQLVQNFANRMEKNVEAWFSVMDPPSRNEDEFALLAHAVAEKCTSHFNVLLKTLAERTSFAQEQDFAPAHLPISPYHISHCFVVSCRSLKFDARSVQIVHDLFGRFVLDRMGGIYGQANRSLYEAGYLSTTEVSQVLNG